MGRKRRGTPDLLRLLRMRRELLLRWRWYCCCGVRGHMRGSSRDDHLHRPHDSRPLRSGLLVVLLWRIRRGICACHSVHIVTQRWKTIKALSEADNSGSYQIGYAAALTKRFAHYIRKQSNPL